LISRKTIIGLIVIIMALGLVACDSSSTPAPNNPSNNPSGGAATLVVPSPPSQANATNITLITTGGVGGVQKLLEVTQGKAKYKSGSVTKTQDVDPTAYSSLMQKITAADFFNLKDSYDKGGVANDVMYNITLQQSGRSKTVKVAQTGGKDITPKPLQDIITQLNNIQSTIAK
jgi:hypothetical protein